MSAEGDAEFRVGNKKNGCACVHARAHYSFKHQAFGKSRETNATIIQQKTVLAWLGDRSKEVAGALPRRDVTNPRHIGSRRQGTLHSVFPLPPSSLPGRLTSVNFGTMAGWYSFSFTRLLSEFARLLDMPFSSSGQMLLSLPLARWYSSRHDDPTLHMANWSTNEPMLPTPRQGECECTCKCKEISGGFS